MMMTIPALSPVLRFPSGRGQDHFGIEIESDRIPAAPDFPFDSPLTVAVACGRRNWTMRRAAAGGRPDGSHAWTARTTGTSNIEYSGILRIEDDRYAERKQTCPV